MDKWAAIMALVVAVVIIVWTRVEGLSLTEGERRWLTVHRLLVASGLLFVAAWLVYRRQL